MAVCLALVWVAGGCVVLDDALIHSRWLAAFVAAAAIAYGIGWARVAIFARLLTLPELIKPWSRRPPP